jgi:preprotein translocase subunit YajC
MALDPQLILIVGFLAIIVFFMFRNNRKRQKDAAKLQEQVAVGADVMTNFGLFGTIVAMDDDENKVDLLTGPGTIVTVHRQTIGRVISPEEPVADEATDSDAPAVESIEASEPEFGERIDPDTATDSPNDKPTDK